VVADELSWYCPDEQLTHALIPEEAAADPGMHALQLPTTIEFRYRPTLPAGHRLGCEAPAGQ
jgi:hypothetical protein